MQAFTIDKAALFLQSSIFFAGALCVVRSNSAELLETLARAATEEFTSRVRESVPKLDLHIQVNTARGIAGGSPRFRGQHHVVVGDFGGNNILIFDMLRRTISGTITEDVARDRVFWRERMLPIFIGMMGASIGVLPMHCASFIIDSEGVLIAGASGAGKSTLSAQLCLMGSDVEYIADDWTYVTQQQHGLLAHGVGARIKLLEDARRHFDALSTQQARPCTNGEIGYEVHAGETFAASIRYACTPRWLFFLQRTTKPGATFTALTPQHTYTYLLQNIERLPTQLAIAEQRRSGLLNDVAALPAWEMSYGGSPRFGAEKLRQFIADLRLEHAG